MAFPSFEVETIKLDPTIDASITLEDSLPYFLRHNWESPLEVQSSILIRSKSSFITGDKTSTQTLHRPTRSMRMTAFAHDGASQAHLHSFLKHAGRHIRVLAPLHSDTTTLRAAVSQGNTLFQMVTSHRRISDNQFVFVHPGDGSFMDSGFGEKVPAFFSRISKVSGITWQFEDPAWFDLGQGWCVTPAFFALPSLQHTQELSTAQVGSADVEFKEYPSAAALPPIEQTTTPDSPVEQYNGRTVFRHGINFNTQVRHNYLRPGRIFTVGNGALPELYEEYPRDETVVSLFFESRADYWPMLSFFESLRGSNKALWMPFPSVWWSGDTTISTGSPEITLPARGYLQDILREIDQGISLMFYSEDGNGPQGKSWTVREVTSLSVVDIDTWTFNLDAGLTPGTTYRAVTPGYTGYLSRDSIKEKWYSLEVLEVDLHVQRTNSHASIDLTP